MSRDIRVLGSSGAFGQLAAWALALAALARTTAVAQTHVTVSSPVAPRSFDADLNTLPKVSPWQPGDPVKPGPLRRNTHPENGLNVPAPAPGQRDPLLDAQPLVRRSQLTVSVPTALNFDGQGFTGVAPPDTVGDVGLNHYIQMINSAGGAQFEIYDKSTGASVAGPSMLGDLFPGVDACKTGFGDGIVLFDSLATRWLMAEFADQSLGNHLCVYISKTSDPISGGWWAYDFTLSQFPDYPKYAVWPDAYYVSTNENDPAAYALDRAKMLNGLPATFQRFTAPPLAGFGFQALTPSDLDGPTGPPLGSPNFFMRHRDDEAHNSNPDPLHDFLEIWEFHADFNNPGNSTFSLAQTIPVAEFDSNLCGLNPPISSCFPQPNGGTPLDPIREVIMWRLQYRNVGAYQTLVGNFVTDVDGTDHGGIRWFELRRTGTGAWSLFQEGTYAPDANDRWLGSIAMDGSGNMALGFSITSTSVFPSIRFTGRAAGDPAGTMTVAETTIKSGTGSQGDAFNPNERWGDYSSLNVDPVDNCTLWYTNEYIPSSGNWKTRVARFRFSSPTCTDTPPPTCGNNVQELGEDCDGTDDINCHTLCRPDCTCPAPVCGNNVVEVGEECDGTSAAACGSATCGPSCTCEFCPASPSSGCHVAAAGTSSISIRSPNPANPLANQVIWKWKGTFSGPFGDPAGGNAEYRLCIYDATGKLQEASAPPGTTCGSQPCWKSIANGFRYRNRAATPDGLTSVQVKSSLTPAKAQITVKGRGANLHPPNPALTPPCTAQLLMIDGTPTDCWQTQFTTFTRNDDQTFSARGP